MYYNSFRGRSKNENKGWKRGVVCYKTGSRRGARTYRFGRGGSSLVFTLVLSLSLSLSLVTEQFKQQSLQIVTIRLDLKKKHEEEKRETKKAANQSSC